LDVRGLYEQEAARAYAFARQLTGGAAQAEDAVAEAFCLLAAGRARAAGRAELLALVRRCAIGAWRAERARRNREEGYAVERGGRDAAAVPAEAAEQADLVRSARSAMGMLSPAERAVVNLCCEQGLGPAEAAEVMSLPLETVRSHRRRGLERLRELLSAAGGFGAAALVAERLAGTLAAAPVEPLPAALSAKLSGIVDQSAAAPAAAATATKGGLLMKIGLGFVAAAMLAAGIAVLHNGVVGAQHALRQAPGPEQGRGAAPLQGPPAATSEKKSKFDIPVWHPDARWEREKEPFAGSGAPGELEGPRREVQWRWAVLPTRKGAVLTGGTYTWLCYDPGTERYHSAAGAARGCFDGPFSRARFGGWDYSHRGRGASSPDGRYVFFTEPWQGQILRQLDFVKQEVKTILSDTRGIGPMTADSTGRLHVVKGSELVIFSGDGKVERQQALDMQEKFGGLGASIALDEKNGRLYGAGYGMKKWYVFYWDVKDGSFHGVLPITGAGEPKRGRNEPGPFKGTDLYGEGNVAFGPDDPEHRFVYTGRVDTHLFFRLDLEKQEVSAFSVDKDGQGSFIGSGKPQGESCYGSTPLWMEDGSFASCSGWIFGRIAVFRRTK
jgi:RNA polymerase sigma factor (sigma-70 family)